MIDFLGIGAQKCGTTWLYERLAQHPQVRFPAGKEIHFWDHHLDRGINWWIAQFPETAPDVRKGEITPAYAMLGHEAITTIRSVAPRVRLFYSMRNPIARAWALSLMVLVRAGLSIEETPDQWFIDHFHSRASRQRGDYLQCIQNWLAVFPEESLQLIVLDDICADPRSVLIKLSHHLSIDPLYFAAANLTELSQPVFQGPSYDIRGRLLESLRDLYAAEIERLGCRLGRDLTHWLQWNGMRYG
ncbi:MAG TPA: sulfotransferase domain-containing protein [Methylocella sp.]|jgi:hypothetical protein